MKCSGQSAVLNGGVHAQQYAAVRGRLSTECASSVPECASSVAGCVPKTIDLTDLLGCLRNSVYSRIWELAGIAQR